MRDTVLIIGSGLMGCGIAAVAALAGRKVILNDRNAEIAEKGIATAAGCIDELLESGLADKTQADRAKMLITAKADLAAACESANLVIEAVVENLEVKQNIFITLDGLLPVTVPILSNTSGLRITDISAKMDHPERTLTAHFWFPAHLVPLVEVVIGDNSDPSFAEPVRDELKTWGKAPVIVKKDLPGQLANRILQAIIREAVNIVEIGLATPEDVDTAVKMGMGIRFPVWGPLEHIEAVGLDLGYHVQKTVLPGISANAEPSPMLKGMVERGDLGYKTGKGFYDWSKKDMDALAARRNKFIIEARKFMKQNP